MKDSHKRISLGQSIESASVFRRGSRAVLVMSIMERT